MTTNANDMRDEVFRCASEDVDESAGMAEDFDHLRAMDGLPQCDEVDDEGLADESLSLRQQFDRVGWTPRSASTYPAFVFAWMEQATQEIESLRADLERERKERREADATLDAHIWGVQES